MFSVQKIFWVALAIYIVWTLFKWFERKSAAQSHQHDAAEKDSSVEVSECQKCGQFVSKQGCAAENCVMRQN